MMRRLGVAAFQENGRSVVLPEYARNSFFSTLKTPMCGEPLARRSSQACNGTGGGVGGGSLPTIATIVIPAGGSVTIGASDFDFTDVQGTNLQAVLNYSGGDSIGPIYSVTPPVQKNCIGEAWSGIAATATAIGTYLVTNISKYGSLGFWIESFTAGEITLAELIGVVLGALSVADLGALLLAVGATAGVIGALYLYSKCMSGN